MAVRTSAAAVKGVLLWDYDERKNPDLTPFIAAASAVVDDAYALAVAAIPTGNVLYPADRWTLIETWLSAHMYQQADPGYTSRSTGGASGSFKGEKGTGFMSTNYGATALRLDSGGFLKALDGGARASAAWLGQTEPEQQTYDERMGYGQYNGW